MHREEIPVMQAVHTCALLSIRILHCTSSSTKYCLLVCMLQNRVTAAYVKPHLLNANVLISTCYTACCA
jgi:hypothetical protein